MRLVSFSPAITDPFIRNFVPLIHLRKMTHVNKLPVLGLLILPTLGVIYAIWAALNGDITTLNVVMCVVGVILTEYGITMGYRRHYNTSTGKHYANFECLFGFTPALTLGLAIVTIPA